MCAQKCVTVQGRSSRRRRRGARKQAVELVRKHDRSSTFLNIATTANYSTIINYRVGQASTEISKN